MGIKDFSLVTAGSGVWTAPWTSQYRRVKSLIVPEAKVFPESAAFGIQGSGQMQSDLVAEF